MFVKAGKKKTFNKIHAHTFTHKQKLAYVYLELLLVLLWWRQNFRAVDTLIIGDEEMPAAKYDIEVWELAPIEALSFNRTITVTAFHILLFLSFSFFSLSHRVQHKGPRGLELN